MKRLLALLAFTCLYISVIAAPALRDSILITQPDGSTMYILLKGDENANMKTTTDGYALLKDSEGFMRYATQDSQGNLHIINAPKANDVSKRTVSELNFIKSLDKGNFDLYYQQSMSRARQVNAPATRANSTRAGAFPTNGKIKGLIILVEFKDNAFTFSQDYHNRMMNEPGFNEDGTTGSARDYFLDQSSHVFEPDFDVVGPVKLNNNMDYYGANDFYGYDVRPEKMIIDACNLAKSTYGTNFAQYDNDNDGVVDMVYVIYAGYGEHAGASDDTIWPHMWSLAGAGSTLSIDGKAINTYACSSELAGNRGSTSSSIGTFCHEFSHVLGLPDLYNTEDAEVYILGPYDVMEYGCYNNDSKTPAGYSAFERYSVGWMEPQEIDEPMDGMTLPNILENNVAYKLTTANKNEFFLIENRQPVKWDAELPASGMMITHIDYNQTYWENNTVNDITSHPRVKLICADNKPSYSNYQYDLFPNSYGNNEFTDESTPSSKNWSGQNTNKWITDITNKNGIVSFNFMANYLKTPESPVINQVSQSSVLASWEAVGEAESYLLTLNQLVEKNIETIAITEDFAKMSAGSVASPNSTDIASKLDQYTQNTGWTGTKVFQAGGFCKIASGSSYGHITTPSLDLSDYDGTFTFVVKAQTKSGTGYLTVSSDSKTSTITVNDVASTYVFLFTNGTEASTVKCMAMKSSPINIDEIIVLRGDETAQYPNANVYNASQQTRTASTETDWKNYKREKIKDVSITEPTYLIEGLEAGNIYSYTVKAVSGTKLSSSSDEVIINLTGTGIKDIAQQNWLMIDGNSIKVASAMGEVIEVYNIEGKKVFHTVASSTQTVISIAEQGYYIVRKGNEAVKVIIR